MKAGLQMRGLSDVAHDVIVAAYAALQAVVGRRHPSLAWLKWGDVQLVKTAAKVSDGELVHVIGLVIRMLVEKVMDKHGIRILALDPSGDSNILSEEVLVGGRCLSLCVGVCACMCAC